jgi:hypothetical protein
MGRMDVLKFKYSLNNYAVKALFTHNIGGVAEIFPDKAYELAYFEEAESFRI